MALPEAGIGEAGLVAHLGGVRPLEVDGGLGFLQQLKVRGREIHAVDDHGLLLGQRAGIIQQRPVRPGQFAPESFDVADGAILVVKLAHAEQMQALAAPLVDLVL